MKNILCIGTGGTIASEMTQAGLVPGLATQDFLRYIPAVEHICNVTCLQVCNLDSTNITPAHWLQIAAAVQQHYAQYDGFVICHGTDTMAYTAAALSYLIQGSPKPIVITGSQKPIHLEITDSKTNLLDSFATAADGRIGGVQIVFGGVVIAGTRARKMYSKSYGAFTSINYPVLGTVQEGVLLPYGVQPCLPVPQFFAKLGTKVALLKLIPGTDAALLRFLLSQNDAVILESYGVGGVPQGEQGAFYAAVQEGVQAGKTVVVTTQVTNEGSDLRVYNVGNRLKTDLQVLESYDMTTEAVVAKLMWILGHTQDTTQIRRLFYTPIGLDLVSPVST